MTPDGPIKDWLDLTLAAAALVAVVVGWVKVIRPRVRKARATTVAVVDSLVGREEIRDSITGALVQPALPSIGVRMASVENSTALLAEAVTRLTEQREVIESHAALLADHGARIGRLEQQAVERVVTKVESTAAWSAVEAVAKSDKPTPLD